MKYRGNEPELAGLWYCSDCGYEQTPADICVRCKARTDAPLRFPTRSSIGRDGRRSGAFYRGPAERDNNEREDER